MGPFVVVFQQKQLVKSQSPHPNFVIKQI